MNDDIKNLSWNCETETVNEKSLQLFILFQGLIREGG